VPKNQKCPKSKVPKIKSEPKIKSAHNQKCLKLKVPKIDATYPTHQTHLTNPTYPSPAHYHSIRINANISATIQMPISQKQRSYFYISDVLVCLFIALLLEQLANIDRIYVNLFNKYN
jgi:hypothetical protein